MVVKPFVQEQSDSSDSSDAEAEQADENPQTTTPQEVRPQRTKRLPARFRQNIADAADAADAGDTTDDATDADITVFIQGDEPTLPLLTADQSSPQSPFLASRRKELNGLLESGVFEVVDITDVPNGIRVFNSRFVDEIKNPGTDKAFEKSRLVVQAYKDAEKDLVLT
jgi:hypothetical protein